MANGNSDSIVSGKFEKFLLYLVTVAIGAAIGWLAKIDTLLNNLQRIQDQRAYMLSTVTALDDWRKNVDVRLETLRLGDTFINERFGSMSQRLLSIAERMDKCCSAQLVPQKKEGSYEDWFNFNVCPSPIFTLDLEKQKWLIQDY